MTEHERKILATTNAVRVYDQRRRDSKVLADLLAVVTGSAMAVLFALMFVILS